MDIKGRFKKVQAKTGDHYQQLQQWFDSDLGQLISQHEKAELAKVIGNYFGYHLLHMGPVGQLDWLSQSPIRHKIHAALHEDHQQMGDVIRTQASRLPFLENSIDLAILPHVLEFETSPQEVLQEVAYSLLPKGYMIIFGFNPYSLWGIKSKLNRKKEKAWRGNLVCINQLRKWLKECDCTIDFYKTFCFELPLENKKIRENFQWLKSIGQTCWPTNGAVYCLIARKEVATLTPIRMSWRVQNVQFSKKRITEPTGSSRTIMRNAGDKKN